MSKRLKYSAPKWQRAGKSPEQNMPAYVKPPPATFEEKLAERRAHLKWRITAQRADMGRGVVCAVCGKYIRNKTPVEIHEVIIDRGDVQKMAAAARLDIHVTTNCVHLHPRCHNQPQPKDERDKCIRYLIQVAGLAKIYEWIAYMEEKHGYLHAEEKRRLVQAAR
jgi:hypothetical protein